MHIRNFEYTVRRPDGSTVPVEIRSQLWSGTPKVIHVLRDITSRKDAEEKLRQQAIYDQLTGLYTRAHFMEMAEKEFERVRRQGQKRPVLYLDIDGYKKVNDTYGHRAGDVILQEISARIRRQIRTADIAGRVGGDEIAVILTNPEELTEVTVSDVAQRLCVTLADPYHLELVKIDDISASIGISMYPTHGKTIDLLLQTADNAMYRAKAAGGDRFAFYRDDDQPIMH